MTVDPEDRLLWRKVRLTQDEPLAEAPVTSARALRTAIAQGAEKGLGLGLVVIGIEEAEEHLDQWVGSVPADWGLVLLDRGADHSGLAAISPDFRSAIVEHMTTGRVSPAVAVPRPVTRTDVELFQPMFAAFLQTLPHLAQFTSLAPWVAGVVVGGPVPTPRTAGLMLTDTEYRVLRFTIDLGQPDRVAEALIALPLHPIARPPPVVENVPSDWSDKMKSAVLDAQSPLNAVLHRMRLSLRSVEKFEVGLVLPLPGVTVGSVVLLGPQNTQVATARLGQVNGMRAVRIEPRDSPTMTEGVARAQTADYPETGDRGVMEHRLLPANASP